ncbi:hypothetical protein [Flavobacterium geliluteum]|uniref:Uncharacterized protein n=1 Tax=Flavobacterium geliluteum TaxID=2816120 RepID=A0A940XCV5_9FLAO|nr:hypothetical protein [Flavobacterium geliluteum]MBP4139641.1 hypothetical protein [Flavobacterium geliluteum]
MKKIILLIALQFCLVVQAQDFETINKIQNSSLADLKVITNKLVNQGNQKFELAKEKETPEYYLLAYIPVGLSADQKEESRINRYENGVVFKLSKTDQGYKLREFQADKNIMFGFVNSVFYPGANENDFVEASKYRDYLDNTKGYKFHFYSGDSPQSKYRFYSY